MSYYNKIFILVLLIAAGLVASACAFPVVNKKNGQIYIQDRHGEAWEVTQAASLGFDPKKFQYGIGRYAFTPLDDSHLTDDHTSVSSLMRVIGITGGSEARAYSVPRLSRHEIANSTIAGSPIAVGY